MVVKEEQAPAEAGGIVTVVKAEQSKDVDFVKKLKELNEDADDEPASDETPKDEKKPKNWQEGLDDEGKREVQKLFTNNRRVNRELKDLRTELDSMKTGARREEPVTRRQATELVRPTRPDPLKFADQATLDAAELKYEDELYDYRRAVDKQADAQREQADKDKQTMERFNGMVEKIIAVRPDYEDVMDAADNEVSDMMFGAIVQTGPELGLYFAEHPEESKKIARMGSGADAVEAIIRIKIKLEDAKKPEPKAGDPPPKEKQQDPPKVIGGGQGRAIPKDKSKMSFKERERAAYDKNPGAFNYKP